MGVSSVSMQHAADIINVSVGLDSVPTACVQCGASSPGLSNDREYFLEDIGQKVYDQNGPPLLVAGDRKRRVFGDFSCPAKWDSTVAVGAINSQKGRSRFSNYGVSYHLAFLVMPGGDEDPGGNVSEWTGKSDGGGCFGTSHAAAYASGRLALYASDSKYYDPDQRAFL